MLHSKFLTTPIWWLMNGSLNKQTMTDSMTQSSMPQKVYLLRRLLESLLSHLWGLVHRVSTTGLLIHIHSHLSSTLTIAWWCPLGIAATTYHAPWWLSGWLHHWPSCLLHGAVTTVTTTWMHAGIHSCQQNSQPICQTIFSY